jgi:hypothetical protein
LLYLLDANTIIESSKKYYQFNRVRPFWDWILYHAEKGDLKIPYEIYEENIKGKKDEFVTWFEQEEIRTKLQLNERIARNDLLRVINEGYAPDLNDIEIEKMGRDPFLIAYALSKPNRCVVTLEIPGNNIRHNKKIPNVCQHFGIPTISLFNLIEILDFSIDWKAKTVQ